MPLPPAVDEYLPLIVDEPQDTAAQGSFAAARGAHEAENFPFPDFQIDGIQDRFYGLFSEKTVGPARIRGAYPVYPEDEGAAHRRLRIKTLFSTAVSVIIALLI
jgi:hypothetical protein